MNRYQRGDEDSGRYIMVNEPADIPDFQTDAEEVAFWRTHRFSPAFWKYLRPTPPERLPPVDESRRRKPKHVAAASPPVASERRTARAGQ